MKTLVLGGTRFVGRTIVERALVLGHDVTIFNRGRTNAGLFPDIENIVGDRNNGLAGLTGRSFDAVIDTSAYFPRQVSLVIETLGNGIGHYTFLSSVSAYADHNEPGADERAALATVSDPEVEELGSSYGGFKALCERELDAALPGRAHHVRAGLIAGPYDTTNRFGYWVDRLASAKRVLVPEPPDQPVQLIDVRDLAAWILGAAAAGVVGAFNATGPSLSIRHVLDAIMRAVDSRPKLEWVAEDFLIEHGVEPWTDLPLWLPPRSVPSHRGFMQRSNARATNLGLMTRPVEETADATLEWLRSRSEGAEPRDYGNPLAAAGLAPAREQQLLDAWSLHRKRQDLPH
jgi:2'-hydroxyisoflavone reductase